MRVGLVRNVALGMVALVGLGLAGCDDNPTDFESDETVKITTNPSVMTVPAGVTALLASRTENAGNEPTWEEITASVDGSCGSGAISVDVAADFEPTLQPPGQFDVTGGTTMGETCIQLSGGGANATVEVAVVGDSLEITGAPEFLDLNSSVDLGAVLLSADGTPVSPFDDATDVVWSSDDEDVLTVDAAGLVTAVGVGAATITATWSGFGVSVSSSVTITTNQPTLNILPDETESDSLLIDTSRDLSAELINPTDPPADFGPFDPETDVTWSSSDTDVLTVDATTGVVTAVGPGTATITAVWTGNDDIFDAVDIPVDVPAPNLASASSVVAEGGDLITLTGTGFHPTMTVLADGEPLFDILEPTFVNTTTMTFIFPPGFDGDVAITAGTAGQQSNAVTISRVNDGEPENDASATAPPVTLPLDMYGAMDEFSDPADLTDRFKFSLAVETTISLDLDWDGESGDLDLLVTDDPPTAFQCGFVTATGAVPESGECTLPAGDYILRVDSFDSHSAIYHLEVGVVAP